MFKVNYEVFLNVLHKQMIEDRDICIHCCQYVLLCLIYILEYVSIKVCLFDVKCQLCRFTARMPSSKS